MFRKAKNLTSLNNVVLLRSTSTVCTRTNSTSVWVKYSDVPVLIIKAVFQYGKTDQISIERVDNHAANLYDNEEKLMS